MDSLTVRRKSSRHVIEVGSANATSRKLQSQGKPPAREWLLQHMRHVLSSNQRMVTFLVWVILLAVCWPLALLAVLLYPVVWLLLLPFRIVGIAVGGVLALFEAVVFLPARVLGAR